MEAAVKKVLGTTVLKDTGIGGSGCISAGSTYLTDHGSVFIKVNNESKAGDMFSGEFAGLQTILATNTIRVPKPLAVVKFGKSSAALVMESVKMKSLSSQSQAALGDKLADLHLHNINLWNQQQAEASRVTSLASKYDGQPRQAVRKFGFQVPTSCGYILQDNTWNEDWTKFFIRQRLQFQVDELQKQHRDAELQNAWEPCMVKVESVLSAIKPIPSLLHGDLWSGNVSSVDGEPLIYDPASFYGHHEYDLGIAHMFGGFSKNFYSAYHARIPKEPGFEVRLQIYELFHHLNHWNHFGIQYKRSALKLMASITRS